MVKKYAHKNRGITLKYDYKDMIIKIGVLP